MTAPHGNHSDRTITQLLAKVADYLDTITGSLTILTGNVLRVDKSGTDGAQPAGRWDLPFLTIQAAVTAAASGDTIVIGPGTFTENVLIPNTRTSQHFVGAGMLSTVMTANGAGNTLSWISVGAVMTRLTIRNLTLTAGAGSGLIVNADLGTTSFDDGADGRNGLFLDNVYLSGAAAATLTAVNNVVMTNCIVAAAAPFFFTHCSQTNLRNTQFGAVTFSYVAGGNKPSRALRNKNLFNCLLVSLTVDKLDNAVCDPDCVVTGNIVTTVADDAGLWPTAFSLEFHGTCQGNMSLGHTFTIAPQNAFLCDRCKLVGTLLTPGVGGQRSTVNFRNAVLYASGGGNISAGNFSDLDLIGAQFSHTAGVLVAAGTGTCNRSIHREAISLVIAPLGVVFAVPFTDNLYTVIYETTIAATDVLTNPKAATGFTATSAAVDANASFCVVHQ